MKKSAVLARKYGKEVWMTEHSVSDNIGDRLPNWKEQLEFAQELNECIQAGGTGYIYWYMRAHWAFVSTGEAKYGDKNKTKNKLLPRAYVMSHFSKHVTGSTRLGVTSANFTPGTNKPLEASAYIKGDSVIVMAINTREMARNLKVKLPYNVSSGKLWLSTGNESDKLCQKSDLDITEVTDNYLYEMPAQSLSTFIFTIDQGSTAIEEVKQSVADGPKIYYDLHGRLLDVPKGMCIEKRADGSTRKVLLP
jgi:glucuronoarabinoxylan endo-1,4-beta-xylanase